MNILVRVLRIPCLLLGMAFMQGAFAITGTEFAAIAKKADNLIQNQQYEQAYELLSQYETELAGNKDYDFLLGLSALNSNQPTKAVYALERVIDIAPNHNRARAELARAYYVLGENQAAEQEFSLLKSQKLAPGVKSVIEQYLASINNRFSAQRTQLQWFFESGAGTDSNVNSATATQSIPVPFFNNQASLVLNENALEQDSSFANVAGGLNYSTPVRDDLSFYGNAKLDIRETFDAEEFSTQIADTQIGFNYMRGQNQYDVSLVNQNYRVDSDTLRNLLGLNLQWHRILNAANAISYYIQLSQLEFPDDELRDIDQTTLGFSWSHALRNRSNTVLFIGAYTGDEDAESNLAPQIARDFVGLRTGLEASLGQNRWFLNLNFIGSEYNATDPIFLTTREDDYLDIRTGIRIRLGNWIVSPAVQFIDNDSNIALHSFDRTQLFTSAKINF